jgi:hypothetical protein
MSTPEPVEELDDIVIQAPFIRETSIVAGL